MEAYNKNNKLLNSKKYCFSFSSYPKRTQYFGNDASTPNTDTSIIQREKVWDKNSPYRIKDTIEGSSSNIVLLTPAIFGGLGAFMVSFLLNRRKPRENFEDKVDEEVSGQYLETHSRGCYKLELFLNVLSIISLTGCTAYIYEEIRKDEGMRRFTAVVPTVVIIIFLFASEHYLIYSVCPGSYEGITGNSKIGNFLNLLALSIGAISVGESYGMTTKTTGTKMLLSQESLFNLFVLALLISFAL